MPEAIIATITDVGFDKPHKVVRAECSLKMFESAQRYGLPVLAVDAGSPPDYVAAMRHYGVRVVSQEKPGMGNAQRQALAAAQEASASDATIIWTESEKYPLIPLLHAPVAVRNAGGYDLVMLHRTSLESYPPEQAMSYRLIALAAKYMLGIENDFGWGPTILSKRAVDYYKAYQSTYGDSWDAIHCPKLHILKDGLPWTSQRVNYEHPLEQTAAETGMALFMKRIEQARQLVGAMTAEVGRLSLTAAEIQRSKG